MQGRLWTLTEDPAGVVLRVASPRPQLVKAARVAVLALRAVVVGVLGVALVAGLASLGALPGESAHPWLKSVNGVDVILAALLATSLAFNESLLAVRWSSRELALQGGYGTLRIGDSESSPTRGFACHELWALSIDARGFNAWTVSVSRRGRRFDLTPPLPRAEAESLKAALAERLPWLVTGHGAPEGPWQEPDPAPDERGPSWEVMRRSELIDVDLPPSVARQMLVIAGGMTGLVLWVALGDSPLHDFVGILWFASVLLAVKRSSRAVILDASNDASGLATRIPRIGMPRVRVSDIECVGFEPVRGILGDSRVDGDDSEGLKSERRDLVIRLADGREVRHRTHVNRPEALALLAAIARQVPLLSSRSRVPAGEWRSASLDEARRAT